MKHGLRQILFGCVFFLLCSQMTNASPPKSSAWGISNGYWVSAIDQDGRVVVEWRQLANGTPPLLKLAEPTVEILVERGGVLRQPTGWRAPTGAGIRATVLVLLDNRDPNFLFDQLSAVRPLLMVSDFETFEWQFFAIAPDMMPVTTIESEDQISESWLKLKALLDQEPITSSLAPSLFSDAFEELASQPGARKAVIFPETLMSVLVDNLTPNNIRALQAFGVSLFPMITDESKNILPAYITVAGATGGRALPWLTTPPDRVSAFATLRELDSGGIVYIDSDRRRYRLPWEPRFETQVVLNADNDEKLRLSLGDTLKPLQGVGLLRIMSPIEWVRWWDFPSRRPPAVVGFASLFALLLSTLVALPRAAKRFQSS